MPDQSAPSHEKDAAEARAAIGSLFAATIEALGNDVKNLMAANGSAPNQNMIDQFTSDMLKLLAERVKTTLPSDKLP